MLTRRRLRIALLAVALAGVAAAAALAALLAGGWRGAPTRPIVDPMPAAERREALDRAAARTRPARDAAARELEQVQKGR
jgi:hypothetical protein